MTKELEDNNNIQIAIENTETTSEQVNTQTTSWSVSTDVDSKTQKRPNNKWKRTFDRKFDRQPREKKEFEEKMLEVRAVTRVSTGGRQRSFRAIMLVGNRNWKIWLWVANGIDVAIASAKATHDAYKNMIEIDINDDGTVNYAVEKKFKSAKIRLIPATPGTGLKAWSSVRSVLELVWFKNILSKIIGTNNKLNNAILTIKILSSYKKFSKNGDYFTKKIAEKAISEASLEIAKPTKDTKKPAKPTKKLAA